jgi:hypothetical protein
MLTAASDGSHVHVVDDYGHTSHFIWRDREHILAWAWHPSHNTAFYLYRHDAQEVTVEGEGIMTENGHCTYLPGNEWILNDTYPSGNGERWQHLYTCTKSPMGAKFLWAAMGRRPSTPANGAVISIRASARMGAPLRLIPPAPATVARSICSISVRRCQRQFAQRLKLASMVRFVKNDVEGQAIFDRLPPFLVVDLRQASGG